MPCRVERRTKAASLGQGRNWGISAAGTAVDVDQLKTGPACLLSFRIEDPVVVAWSEVFPWNKCQLWLGNKAYWGHPARLGLLSCKWQKSTSIWFKPEVELIGLYNCRSRGRNGFRHSWTQALK